MINKWFLDGEYMWLAVPIWNLHQILFEWYRSQTFPGPVHLFSAEVSSLAWLKMSLFQTRTNRNWKEDSGIDQILSPALDDFSQPPSSEPWARANEARRKNSVLTIKGQLSGPQSTTNCLWAPGGHLPCAFYSWLFTVQMLPAHWLCTSSWLAHAVGVLGHHGPCSSVIVHFPKDLSLRALGIH